VASLFAKPLNPSNSLNLTSSAKLTLAELEANLRAQSEDDGKSSLATLQAAAVAVAEAAAADAQQLRGGVNGAATMASAMGAGGPPRQPRQASSEMDGNGNGKKSAKAEGSSGERRESGDAKNGGSAARGYTAPRSSRRRSSDAAEEEDDTAQQVAAIRAHLASSSKGTPPPPSSGVQPRSGLRQIPSGHSLDEFADERRDEFDDERDEEPPLDRTASLDFTRALRDDHASHDPGFFSSLIQLIGEAVVGEELVVNNVENFDRLQWQRVEAVEQADGSSKKFVEAIAGSENKARYRVAREDEVGLRAANPVVAHSA
jgi:hypothetical protein